MEDGKKSENHLTSAAAFVEGGVQEACDDACSICLETFCESEPSTVTVCKHEFHLQCILECCWSHYLGLVLKCLEPELPYLIDISIDLAYVGDSGQAPISSFSSRGQERSKR